MGLSSLKRLLCGVVMIRCHGLCHRLMFPRIWPRVRLQTQDVGALLEKGVSEVVRDAARLHEQLMGLKLARGKLEREEVLLREKVGNKSADPV